MQVGGRSGGKHNTEPIAETDETLHEKRADALCESPGPAGQSRQSEEDAPDNIHVETDSQHFPARLADKHVLILHRHTPLVRRILLSVTT